MNISVIIPVFNDPRLEGCLDALSKQSLAPDDFEVIVIDNGSASSLVNVVARYPFARLSVETTPGSFAARNLGLKMANGEILAFTDSDCLPDSEWLASGVAAIRSAVEQVAIGGKIVVYPAKPDSPNAAELVDIAFGFDQQRTIEAEGFAVTANLFATRKAFCMVGGFNQQLLSGGDGEWCQRAAAAGIKTVYCPDAIVSHPARATLGELAQKRRRTVGGRISRNTGRTSAQFLRAAMRQIFPDLRNIARGRRKLAERGLGWRSGVRLTWMMFVLHYLGLLEYVRIKLGGAKERR